MGTYSLTRALHKTTLPALTVLLAGHVVVETGKTPFTPAGPVIM